MQNTLERHFQWFGDELRLRVGLVFPSEEAPNKTRGAIRYPVKPDAPLTKFYLRPPKRKLKRGSTWRIPKSVQHAPWGELVLNKRPDCTVIFARHEESEPFTFGKDQRYIALRINRPQDGGFNPLYVEVQKDYSVRDYCLTVEWKDAAIVLKLREINREDAPAHLSGSRYFEELMEELLSL